MRLVFFYTRDGAGKVQYDPKKPSQSRWARELPEEGLFWLLKQAKALKYKIIDDLFVIIESARGSGQLAFHDADRGIIRGQVIPDISMMWDYVKPDDVIFIRGGFKTWFTHLERLKKEGHWLLLYGANTGRERWKIWDVIFDDLSAEQTIHMDTYRRLWWPYVKPVNPNIFQPLEMEKIYDVCIGASHIHDKKGQWLAVQSIVKYEQKYRERVKCVLPGRPYHGVKSNQIVSIIQKNNLDVSMPGMIPRADICRLMNQSKVFIHAGGGGQNDRGPIEALACGTPIILTNRGRHGPMTYSDPIASCVVKPEPEEIAKAIRFYMSANSDNMKKWVVRHFNQTCNVENVILPRFKILMDVIRKYPDPKKGKEVLCQLKPKNS